MKYLDLYVDNLWHFAVHFGHLVFRLEKVAAAYIIEHRGTRREHSASLCEDHAEHNFIRCRPNGELSKNPQRIQCWLKNHQNRMVSYAITIVLTAAFHFLTEVYAKVYDLVQAFHWSNEDGRTGEARCVASMKWASQLFFSALIKVVLSILDKLLDCSHGCFASYLCHQKKDHGRVPTL